MALGHKTMTKLTNDEVCSQETVAFCLLCPTLGSIGFSHNFVRPKQQWPAVGALSPQILHVALEKKST